MERATNDGASTSRRAKVDNDAMRWNERRLSELLSSRACGELRTKRMSAGK